MTKYQGSAVEAISVLFEEAKKIGKPCVIFIDEIDSIAQNRSDEKNRDRYDAVNIFLSLLELFEDNDLVLIIAATNKFEELDSAITSRFRKSIEISLPNVKNRLAIINHYLKNIPHNAKKISDSEINDISEFTSGFSARDIKELISQAIDDAINKKSHILTKSNIYEAMKNIMNQISIEKIQKHQKKEMELSQRRNIKASSVSSQLSMLNTALNNQKWIFEKATEKYSFAIKENAEIAINQMMQKEKDILQQYFLEDCLYMNQNKELIESEKESLMALHKAVETDNLELVRSILKFNVIININQQNNIGQTPLHVAIQNENKAIVLELINCGASLYILDSNNKTPIDYINTNNQELAKLVKGDKSSCTLQ